MLIPPTFNTIAEVLASQADAFSMALYMNASTAYASVLKDANFKGTLLVPRDDAFLAFLANNAFAVTYLLATVGTLQPVLNVSVCHVLTVGVLDEGGITGNGPVLRLLTS